MRSTLYILTAVLATLATAAPIDDASAVGETNALGETNTAAEVASRKGWCADRRTNKIDKNDSKACCKQVGGSSGLLSGGKCTLSNGPKQAAFTGCCNQHGKKTVGL